MLAVTVRGQPLVRDVAIVLVGYFSPSTPITTDGNLKFIPPARVLETRPGSLVGFDSSGAPLTAGAIAPNQINQYRLAGKTFGSFGEGNQVTFAGPGRLTGGLAHVTVVQPATPISFNSWATGISAAGNLGRLGVFSTGDVREVIIDLSAYFR